MADQCVQCGLCLPVCPTYAVDPIETESPRGRIALAKAWDSGFAVSTTAGDQHLDHCLGCRRCEAACPAGVQYGDILTLARTAQRQRRPPGRRQRMLEALAAHPELLRRLLIVYRWAYPLLPSALRPLPKPPASSRRDATDIARRRSQNTPRVALFTGCVARGYDGPLHAAMIKLCAAVGVQVEVPRDQTCCGSLHAHAGDPARADVLATQNRTIFATGATVLNLASGCHSQLLDTLRGQADVVDAITWLERNAKTLHFTTRHERVALHLPCTQRTASRSDDALRGLLARVPGLEVIVLDAGAGCCGAAGTQMLTEPERAARLRRPLLDQAAASGATRLLSANIGCRLHLANAATVPVQHPLEFLGACLAE